MEPKQLFLLLVLRKGGRHQRFMLGFKPPMEKMSELGGGCRMPSKWNRPSV